MSPAEKRAFWLDVLANITAGIIIVTAVHILKAAK